ncbi:MAG: AMP-binding protein, partial [Synergistales bacterium]|nr:AMP-binding protein [Synergistales bacterium]
APLGLRPLQLVMANPLHHANSSALSDWCMREPGAVIHMLPRYGTAYWRVLAEAASSGGELLAPAVARHIDFLHNLAEEGALPIPEERLREVLPRVHFLLGSAPVGPTTVERIRAWTGRPPLVRFGSTETCLQALGTPTSLSPEESMEAFRRGWHHTPSPGYYIGRPHPPHTEAAVVRSTDPADAGYLVPCPNGEEGYLIARGGHVMAGYLNDTEATREVLRDGWYLGFGDIGFTLTSPADGGRDHYWLGRDSALVIRGGANYACDQISAELTAFLEKRYGIAPSSVDLAVVGMRMESEHEDSCCVTIDTSRLDRETEAELRRSFIEEARRKVSRGARPDRLRFGAVPRNFKGAVRIRELKELWRTETATPENTHREDDDGNAS